VCLPLHVGNRELTSSCNNFSWEFMATIGFDWDVFQGKRPYRWTIWVSSLRETGSYYHLNEYQIYFGTRYIGLLGFVFLLLNIDSVRLNCQVRLAPYFGLVQRSLLTSASQPIMVTNWVREQYRSYLFNDTDLLRHWVIPLWHSRLSLSFSACRSSL